MFFFIKSHSNLAIVLFLGSLFSSVGRFSLKSPCQKFKSLWKGLLTADETFSVLR